MRKRGFASMNAAAGSPLRSACVRSQTGLSSIPTRMKMASSAGATPTMNSARQPKCGNNSAWAPAAAKKPHS